jgi:TonB family protein
MRCLLLLVALCAVIDSCVGIAAASDVECAWGVIESRDATAADVAAAARLSLRGDRMPMNRVANGYWAASVETDSLQHPRIVLENLATRVRRDLGEGSRPLWSPDGSMIACTVWKYIERPWVLSIIDLRTGERTEPEIGCLADEMEWSPDGRWLAVAGTHYRQPVTVLCVVSARGGESVMLTDCNDFDWSPESRAIVVTRVTATTLDDGPIASDLWLFEPNGMRCQLTTTNFVLEGRPRWIGPTTIVYAAKERARGEEHLRALTLALPGSLPYDTPPELLHRVPARYPEFARQAHIREKVILRALVDTSGRVSDLQFVRAVVGLDSAAAECVRQWIFKPARKNGKAVPAWQEVSVWFPIDACPPQVLNGARAAVIARVGQEFFSKNLSLDSSGCVSVRGRWIRRPEWEPEHWTMAYALRMPGRPWVKGTIRVDVDSGGSILPGHAVEGIGDCARHPKECDFSVNEGMARKVATRAGLEAGIGSWEVGFQWVTAPRACYAWVVRTTLVDGTDEERGGKSAIIDAASGRLLGIFPWGRQTKEPQESGARH